MTQKVVEVKKSFSDIFTINFLRNMVEIYYFH